MNTKQKRKTKPRQVPTVRADLERFPWDNSFVIAGICRVVDIALAKIIAEDKATGEDDWHNWLKRDT